MIKQTSIWLGIGLVSTVSWLHAAELKDIVKDNLCSSIISDRFTSATRSSNCHPGLKTLSIDLTASQTPSTFSLPDGSELNVANTLTFNGSIVPEVWRVKAGHTLDISLKNHLSNADSRLTAVNLHTHGMIVSPSVKTVKKDGRDQIVGTVGDNVFVCSVPTDQINQPNAKAWEYCHTLATASRPDSIHYRIKVPASHPEGVFWYHPHIHKAATDQVGAGLAGLIWVRGHDNFLVHRGSERFMMLKDFPLKKTLANGGWETFQKGGGDDLPDCDTTVSAEHYEGYCNGTVGGVDAKWLFTINGQVLPTMTLDKPEGEIWHIANTSANTTYTLQLVAGSSGAVQTPLNMQLLSRDGVYIAQDNSSMSPAQVGTKPIVMMPASRIDVLVKPQWVAAGGAGNAARLITRGMVTGSLATEGDAWPAVVLGKVALGTHALAMPVNGASMRSARMLAEGITVKSGGADQIIKATREIKANIADVKAQFSSVFHDHSGMSHAGMPMGDPCTAEDLRKLASDEARLVVVNIRRVDIPDKGPTEEFVIGADRIKVNDPDLKGTITRLALDTAKTRSIDNQGPKPQICTRAGRTETWIIANPLADDIAGAGGDAASVNRELHNFHIHQMKFKVLRVDNALGCSPGATGPNVCVSSPPADGRLVDTFPVPLGGRIYVEVPLGATQVGDFVYHCHILEHEDHGMMAHIRVEPEEVARLK